MTDEIDKGLEHLENALMRTADKAGEGQTTMRKSRFVSEVEKNSFIELHGMKAYDRLKD